MVKRSSVTPSNIYRSQEVKSPDMVSHRAPVILKMAATAQFKIMVPCRKTEGALTVSQVHCLPWVVEIGFI